MHKFSSSILVFIGLCGLLFTQAHADAQDCPPPTVPLTSTVRTLVGDTVTVVGSFDGETRNVSSDYEYPYWMEGQVGQMQVTGELSLTNKSAQRRKVTYRMSVLLPEGATPEIRNIQGDDGSALCWESAEQRIVVVYEAILNAGQSVTIPVDWSVLIRGQMLADINNDGRVDGVDQILLINAFGTSDPLADLNSDGVVNAADLAILLLNWSDYSDDVIEVSSNVDVDSIIENSPFRDFTFIATGTVEELVDIGQPPPAPAGVPLEGTFVVPFQDWRHLALRVI